MAKRTKKMAVQELPKYNPAGTYQWQTDDEFTFTGAELDTLNRTLGKFLSGAIDVPNILGLVLAANVIQNKIAQYVEKGTIVEVVQELEQVTK